MYWFMFFVCWFTIIGAAFYSAKRWVSKSEGSDIAGIMIALSFPAGALVSLLWFILLPCALIAGIGYLIWTRWLRAWLEA